MAAAHPAEITLSDVRRGLFILDLHLLEKLSGDWQAKSRAARAAERTALDEAAEEEDVEHVADEKAEMLNELRKVSRRKYLQEREKKMTDAARRSRCPDTDWLKI